MVLHWFNLALRLCALVMLLAPVFECTGDVTIQNFSKESDSNTAASKKKKQASEIASLQTFAIPAKPGESLNRLKRLEWQIDLPFSDVGSGNASAQAVENILGPSFTSLGVKNLISFRTVSPEKALSVLLKRSVGVEEVNAASFVYPDFILDYSITTEDPSLVQPHIKAVRSGDVALASRLLSDLKLHDIRLTAGPQDAIQGLNAFGEKDAMAKPAGTFSYCRRHPAHLNLTSSTSPQAPGAWDKDVVGQGGAVGCSGAPGLRVELSHCRGRVASYSGAFLTTRELFLKVDYSIKAHLEGAAMNTFGAADYSLKTSDFRDFYVNHVSEWEHWSKRNHGQAAHFSQVSQMMGHECAVVTEALVSAREKQSMREGAEWSRVVDERVPGLVLVPFWGGSAQESGGNSHSEATKEHKFLQAAGTVCSALKYLRRAVVGVCNTADAEGLKAFLDDRGFQTSKAESSNNEELVRVYRPSVELGYGAALNNATAKEAMLKVFQSAHLFLNPVGSKASRRRRMLSSGARNVTGEHERWNVLNNALSREGLAGSEEGRQRRRMLASDLMNSGLSRNGRQRSSQIAKEWFSPSPPSSSSSSSKTASESSSKQAPPQPLPPPSTVLILKFECAKGVHLPYHLLATVQALLKPGGAWADWPTVEAAALKAKPQPQPQPQSSKERLRAEVMASTQLPAGDGVDVLYFTEADHVTSFRSVATARAITRALSHPPLPTDPGDSSSSSSPPTSDAAPAQSLASTPALLAPFPVSHHERQPVDNVEEAEKGVLEALSREAAAKFEVASAEKKGEIPSHKKIRNVKSAQDRVRSAQQLVKAFSSVSKTEHLRTLYFAVPQRMAMRYSTTHFKWINQQQSRSDILPTLSEAFRLVDEDAPHEVVKGAYTLTNACSACPTVVCPKPLTAPPAGTKRARKGKGQLQAES